MRWIFIACLVACFGCDGRYERRPMTEITKTVETPRVKYFGVGDRVRLIESNANEPLPNYKYVGVAGVVTDVECTESGDWKYTVATPGGKQKVWTRSLQLTEKMDWAEQRPVRGGYYYLRPRVYPIEALPEAPSETPDDSPPSDDSA